jgi:hypothetical protein
VSSRVLGLPVAALLGLCAGVVGTLASSVALAAAGLALPVGLVLALALTTVVQAGTVAAWPTSATAAAGALGWAAGAGAGLVTGPGGDFLLARPLDLVGAGWLVGGPIVLAMATRTVRRTAPDPAVPRASAA